MADSGESFITRIRLAASQNSDLKIISKWICENTSDPRKIDKPFSFKDHEFQKEILECEKPIQTITKVSQIGLSEISARKALALCALRIGINLIYSMPTSKFSQMFSKTRLDPIIRSSKTLRGMVDRDTNSASLKGIGSSFMHLVGSFSESAPISVPASYVISDEVDFSDQSVLSEFASRLGHEKQDESMQIGFSTPTTDNYGISASYEKSSKGRYFVKCKCCGLQQAPDFYNDVIIPELDMDIRMELHAHHVAQHLDLIAKAYVKCRKCGKDLMPSLLDPSMREWIHEFPDKDHYGFKVSPLDVPTINPPARTLKQMLDYKRKASWVNYKLGLPFKDDTSSISTSVIRMQTVILPGEIVGARDVIIGVDIGLQTWVTIGKPTYNTITGAIEGIDILQLRTIEVRELEHSLGEELIVIAKAMNAVCMVIDAAPDFSASQQAHRALDTGKCYGCYYTETRGRTELSSWKKNETKGIVVAGRTDSLDELSNIINNYKMRFPFCKETEVLIEHAGNISRIEDEEGTARWVSSGDEHFIHSLNYLVLAAQIANSSEITPMFFMPPGIKAVKMGNTDRKAIVM